MSKTTTLAPGRPPPAAAPTTVPIRPSDRLGDDLPRHAPHVIPVRPRRAVIVIETAAEPAIRVLDPSRDDDLDALEYSSELL
jgi:hypothetical protein